jgi:hypothetical protein
VINTKIFIKNKGIIPLISLFFIFVLISIPISSADDINYYSNKIFSDVNGKVYLVAPNDNNSLDNGSSYEFYLFSSLKSVLYINTNNVTIAYKAKNATAIKGLFYVDAKVFNLVVLDNATKYVYISIHYISIGGYIPLPENHGNEITRWKKSLPQPSPPKLILLDNVIKLIGLLVLLVLPSTIVIGLYIKFRKETTTVEGLHVVDYDYYEIGKHEETPKRK